MPIPTKIKIGTLKHLIQNLFLIKTVLLEKREKYFIKYSMLYVKSIKEAFESIILLALLILLLSPEKKA